MRHNLIMMMKQLPWWHKYIVVDLGVKNVLISCCKKSQQNHSAYFVTFETKILYVPPLQVCASLILTLTSIIDGEHNIYMPGDEVIVSH